MDGCPGQSRKQLEAVTGQWAGLQAARGRGRSTLFLARWRRLASAGPGPDLSPSAFWEEGGGGGGISPEMEWRRTVG